MATRLQQKAGSAVDEFVGGVERRLEAMLAGEGTSVPAGKQMLVEASRHLTLSSGAKRARPRLVHHFGTALSLSDDKLVRVAVAGELIHTASLLHDDVIDEGTERRDKPTVNVQWNNITAVLTGDSLLCSALCELNEFESQVVSAAIELVSDMTDSLMHEVQARRRTDLQRDDWWTVAEGKTGALFGWCGRATAMVSDDELVERFGECGRRLGLAFQLADDLKDIVEFDSGKDQYADIRNGNPSYPLICAIDDRAEIGEMLRAYWEVGDAAHSPRVIARAVLDTSALEETRRMVHREVSGALEALGDYSDQPGGAQIADWADQLCEVI